MWEYSVCFPPHPPGITGNVSPISPFPPLLSWKPVTAPWDSSGEVHPKSFEPLPLACLFSPPRLPFFSPAKPSHALISKCSPSGPSLYASHVLFPLPGTPSPTLHGGEPHSALLSTTQEAGSDALLPSANLALLWTLLLPGLLWGAGSLPDCHPGARAGRCLSSSLKFSQEQGSKRALLSAG